ncbi:hypothetical protein HCA69_15970 [Listeria grandensis]|uniref:Uncharacterized protein n=1 Tax=Listeria grandensis TaxID=1494963 RepID=A0A7X0Y6F3_9LIST|nr:hypothetical protein [Listeria grandensis]MBC1937861.1 hypothetical protein [Listeria grandensis]
MDVTLFAVRALSINWYKSEIDALYAQYSVDAYEVAKNSEYWHSRGIRELPVSDEAQARKALGIVLLAVKNEELSEKLRQVVLHRLGGITKKFINRSETESYYQTHKEKLIQQIDALPQRLTDYVLILLDGNGTDKLAVAKYAQTLLEHWNMQHAFFEALPSDRKDEAMSYLVNYFPSKKFTTYYDFQKTLQKQEDSRLQLEAFQYFFTSEFIATEEYANDVMISKRELRDLFAVATWKELPASIMPFYVLSGIESLIIAKSFNQLRSKIFKQDLELVDTKERIVESNEQTWQRENKMLKQETQNLRKQLDNFEQKQREWNQKEIKSRDEVISALERQLELKNEEIKSVSSGPGVIEESQVMIDLNDYQIAVVGGYTSLNQDLEKKGIVCFQTVDRLTKSLIQFDYVFLLTAFTSHKVKLKLDHLKVRYLYIASDTRRTIFEEMEQLIDLNGMKKSGM